MAVPSTLRDPSGGAPPLGRLLDHVVGLLVDHVTSPNDPADGWRFGPLLIVSAAEGFAAAALAAAAAAQGATLAAADVATWHGEALGREIAAALEDDRIDRFAAALAAMRLVVVDGIDCVGGGERQESLAHLLDTSTAAGTVWCVSVPRLPPEGLEPRCATRVSAGLILPVTSAPMTTHAAGPVPSLGRVIRAAARHHDVSIDAVLGPARHRTVAAARSLAMYLARRLTGRSLQAIGAACGGRDHTTVLHAVRMAGARIARDPAFAADVERLAVALSGAADTRSGHAGRRRSDVGSAVLGRTLSSRRRGRRRQA